MSDSGEWLKCYGFPNLIGGSIYIKLLWETIYFNSIEFEIFFYRLNFI